MCETQNLDCDMKTQKIKIAFAEDNADHVKRIVTTISAMQNFEISIKATSGRDLILQLVRNPKKLPTLILMDMQMPCCDGLLCTTICKWLFPQIKIVGFSAHTDGIVVGEFFSEGGDAFLSKLIMNKPLAAHAYKNENIFEDALVQIATTNKGFIDIMLDDTGEAHTNRVSTLKLISKNCINLTSIDIKIMQLNAAGFTDVEMSEIINVSKWTIKKYCDNLRNVYKVSKSSDLLPISISLGVAKILRTYQPPINLHF